MNRAFHRAALALLAAAAALLFAAAAAAGPPRARIVFLLGEDAPGATPFFAPARAWYSERQASGTVIVDSARTLAAVREVLARSHARGEVPWGEVVLVGHGSQWTGLAVPLFHAGDRSAPERLATALARGEFPPLPDAVLDSDTRLVIESCGVGRRPDLLASYAALFGGDGQQPSVTASRELVAFHALVSPSGVVEVRRKELPYVSRIVDSPRRLQAQRELLVSTLRERAVVPDDAVHWVEVPIAVRVPVAGALQESLLRARPERLAGKREVAVVLRANGLDARDLAWALDCAGGGPCALVGRGTAVSASVGAMPMLVPTVIADLEPPFTN